MGTPFDQKPRAEKAVKESELNELLSMAARLSKKHKVAVSDVLTAQRVLELRRANDLFVENGNVFDEQMGGLGKLIKDLTLAIDGSD